MRMIWLWNTLQQDIRTADNYSDFIEYMHEKYHIHEYKKVNLFKYGTEIDNLYLELRFQCSLSNAEIKLNMTQTPQCLQCYNNKQETIHYYFIDCPTLTIKVCH